MLGRTYNGTGKDANVYDIHGQLGTSVWSRRKDSDKEFVCGDLSLVIILIIATIY